jgi:hypothetical protein
MAGKASVRIRASHPAVDKVDVGQKTITMQICSRKKVFPITGAFALLMSIAFIARGIYRFGDGDPEMFWLQIILGIFLLISWTSRIRNEVVQIIVNDEEIRYRRRSEKDLVIQRSEIIDTEVLTSRINYRYKGSLDVQSVSIPLRRFHEKDVERLKELFSNEEFSQQAAS